MTPAGESPIPPWWAPLAWGLALPTAVHAAGLAVLAFSRPAAGVVLILWPLATIAGMSLGGVALMRRLFRGSLPTAAVFLLTGLFALACLGVQAALAIRLGVAMRAGPP